MGLGSLPPARSMFSAQEQANDAWPAAATPPQQFVPQPSRADVSSWNQSDARPSLPLAAIRQPRHYRYAKRALDIVVALAGLILCAPFFLVIALLIRRDSQGPAFFIQQRAGYRGKPFRMVKFRTMRFGSEVQVNEGYKTVPDPRVTRIGSWLRKSSIDEVPQLLNVLLGQMSLVGPRPELPEVIEAFYEPWQYRRFQVPQGMTGWWQVTGRGSKLLYQHTDDDIYYIDHASFMFDLMILLRTVRAVIRREGAF